MLVGSAFRRATRDDGRRNDGLTTDERQELRRLKRENRRLKQMYADLSLKSRMQEEIIKKL